MFNLMEHSVRMGLLGSRTGHASQSPATPPTLPAAGGSGGGRAPWLRGASSKAPPRVRMPSTSGADRGTSSGWAPASGRRRGMRASAGSRGTNARDSFLRCQVVAAAVLGTEDADARGRAASARRRSAEGTVPFSRPRGRRWRPGAARVRCVQPQFVGPGPLSRTEHVSESETSCNTALPVLRQPPSVSSRQESIKSVY